MSGKKHHYGRQILVTILITVIILLILAFCFAKFLVPLFNVHPDQIYSVLTKLFPLLIGLVLIECGVLIAHRRDEDYADQVDLLPPNAYDKPLATLPGDDPDHGIHADGPNTVLASDIDSKDELPVEEVQTFVAAPAVMPVVEPTVIIKEVPVEVEVPAPRETFEDTFNIIMEQELQSSIDVGYDISLTLIEITAGDKPAVAELLVKLTSDNAFSSLLDNGKIAIILPFYQYDEARRFLQDLLDSCKNQLDDTGLQIGFASRNGRIVDVDQLYHEAEVACSLAGQDGDVIGFEDDSNN